MTRLEIEIDDKGEFVGDLPEPLKAILTREQTMSYGNGFKNGVSETTEKTKKQFEDTLKLELAKKEALAPLEREKFARIEEENAALNARLTESMRESNQTLRAREEAHARELLNRTDALSTRNARITALVGEQLEGLAMSAGAREESLPELKVILGNYIGFSDDMEPFIKGEDGQPRRLSNGNPVTLKAFVKDYIDSHAHHKAPSKGVGGGARGGAVARGYQAGTTPSLDAAKARIDRGDRSNGAITELFEASRKRAG
jgi:hypothetical protein